MTREDICTCGQYSQCTVCNKSRSNYAELMQENERMKIALKCVARYVSVPEPRRGAGPHEQILQQRLDNAVGICRDVLTEVEP